MTAADRKNELTSAQQTHVTTNVIAMCILQVIDMRRLRGLESAPPGNVPDLIPDGYLGTFGQARNVAANEAAQRVYVTGSVVGLGVGVCGGGECR